MDARARQLALAALIAVVAAGVGFAIHAWYFGRSAQTSGGGSGDALQATLKDLSGTPQRLDQWRGKVVLVNFWATWCEPCRKEIPEFVRIQEKYGQRGVQFVGVAVDDAAKVASFVEEFHINYPVVIGGLEALELSRRLGNRSGGLPFTVIFDRAGTPVKTELGAIDEAKLVGEIEKML